MPTLNRFPLLALWAKEAARRVGYRESEAASLGHGYAVLYAIRLRRLTEPKTEKEEKEGDAAARARKGKRVQLGGDELRVVRSGGKLQARVGGEKPQTSASYRVSVERKFPEGYYERLERCFRELMKTYSPEELREGVVYDVYDRWKRRCRSGRLVELDCLLKWCETSTAKREKAALKSKGEG